MEGEEGARNPPRGVGWVRVKPSHPKREMLLSVTGSDSDFPWGVSCARVATKTGSLWNAVTHL